MADLDIQDVRTPSSGKVTKERNFLAGDKITASSMII